MNIKLEVGPRKRLSQRIRGHIKRLFVTDYHLLRTAGLSRQKALAACIGKYVD